MVVFSLRESPTLSGSNQTTSTNDLLYFGKEWTCNSYPITFKHCEQEIVLTYKRSCDWNIYMSNIVSLQRAFMMGVNSSGLSKQASGDDSCCWSGEKSLSVCADTSNRALPYETISQPCQGCQKLMRLIWRCVLSSSLSLSPFFPPYDLILQKHLNSKEVPVCFYYIFVKLSIPFRLCAALLRSNQIHHFSNSQSYTEITASIKNAAGSETNSPKGV